MGAGSPLLLITGFGASMDDWPPSFVDTLAGHHEVIVLDNAGVGQTSAGASSSITAMADQTSDLMSALHLDRSAVLGWSMGGMIAQALAVDHPAQVSRLVLAATQAGTGKALPVPAKAAAQLASPDPATVLAGAAFSAHGQKTASLAAACRLSGRGGAGAGYPPRLRPGTCGRALARPACYRGDRDRPRAIPGRDVLKHAE